jgi:hypothetical protein
MNGRGAAAARLGGFVLLIAVIFLIAYLVGLRVGPVSPVHRHGGGGGGMTMSTLFSGTAPGSGVAR